MAERKCGNCHYWRGEEFDDLRQCHWRPPSLPFWASIDDGLDHEDWTGPEQGRTCAAFDLKEENS